MYTIMTVVGKEIVGRDTDATWSDVIDFATETDEYDEIWTDHDFVEQVRDTGQGLRRYHDGAGTVLLIAFRNQLFTVRPVGEVL